jgi:amino acid adenylation domain-containing protein
LEKRYCYTEKQSLLIYRIFALEMGDIKPKTAAPVAEDIQKIWRQNQAVPGGVERCIHDLFVEQAEARPDAPAICAWDGELTYGELDALSTKLAGHLVELGVKEEDMVPLCFEKSMWTVVAMLAVLKAGGAFVPLDPDHPRIRHEEILEQTKASLVLTSAQHVSLWAGSSLTVVTVSKASIVPLKDKVNLASTATSPRDAAYVMFTSGSTGRPKGVVVEHHALATSCLEQGRAFGLSAHTKTLQFASYTFDACITEIIAALMFGACVCVPSGEDRGNDLAKAINTLGVNWLLLTPTVARLLQPSSTPLVKTVVLGGEQVNYDDCSRWQGHVQVITCYGPTECSVWCSTCTGNEDFKSGTIGKSIASVSWVVDAGNHEQLAPVGSVGELLVEGPILARGYLNDAEKTDAAFISDPTWLLQGGDGYPGRHGRLYKTGDLVRYDTDGNLVYVGRKDDQIKVRGQRVELGDVEHHLRECMPEAQQIAVEVILLEGGEKDNATLAAFLQLDDEARGGPSANGSGESDSLARVVFLREVEEKMLGGLLGQMVPAVYIAVAQLPMTVSGKTDRKRLREIGALFSAQQLAEPRTASEGAKRAPSTEAYWQTALADCEATLFPALPPAVQQPIAEATVHYQCAPLPKTASDTTTSTLVRAAWAILASRYTSSDDVVFGATVTGRNAPVAGIETMLGPTIATVPVRVRIERDQTVLAFLEGVQKQATEMIAYEQTGLQHISKMGAGAQHACSFQTLLVVQPADDGLAGDSALGERRGGSGLQGFTTYGLVVQCTLAAEGVGITASFDKRIIERWLVERMLGQLSFVMQQLAAAEHETTTVGSIDTLTPEDKQQLWEWNSEVPAAVTTCSPSRRRLDQMRPPSARGTAS